MNSFDTSSRPTLTAISSMATRQVLAELARVNVEGGGIPVALESVGGVDAAKRVAAGEMFDLVFLASDALAKLIAGGHVLADSRVDLVRSQVAIAVKSGLPVPAITAAADVRSVLMNAPTIGYSTGPSGTALLALFERWGITPEIKSKLRQAPAGVPVATIVANGDVALGFQQRSEMIDAPGINVIGDLPAEIAIETIFSGGVCATSTRVGDARALLAAFASPAHAGIKAKHGMAAI